MSDLVVKQIAQAIGSHVGGVIGSQMAGAAVAAAMAEAEMINLINNVKDGKATAADVIAITAAIEAAILASGIVLTTAGVISGIGASVPIATVAVISMSAWVFYQRDGTAVQDSIDSLIDAVKRGEQPWTFVPRIIDDFNRTSYKRNVTSEVNTSWRSATASPPRDPLAIDLDGDGIETLAIGAAPILFDHDANGIKTGTGWLKGDDAWLVLDRNGNGSIDSGRELFGVDTLVTDPDGTLRNATSGFDALKSADSNGDGVFNSTDAAFAEVRLWQDLNGNGVSETNELASLTDKGIVSIALTPTSTTTNLGNGNAVSGSATVVRHSGTTTVSSNIAVNLNLADNPFYREFTDTVELTDAARAWPAMQGSGWVSDLREAMSLEGDDSDALELAGAAYHQRRFARRPDALSRWAALLPPRKLRAANASGRQ